MKKIDWHQHEDAMSLKEELNSILEGNQLFQGVIWLHPMMIGSKEELDSDGDIWLQHALIFSGAIKNRLDTEGSILYVAQGSGNLGSSENGSLQVAQSLSALAKTVQAEWVATHGRFIDLHKDFESVKFAELVWQELNDPNLSRNQVGWDQNLQRWEYERVLHIPQFTQQELPFSS